MNVEEYLQQLEQFKEDLLATFPEFCLQQGMNAKALIQNRIQEQGTNADGGQLTPYSTNPLPPFFFTGKGNKAASAQLAKEFPDGISYADWRKLNGRQIDHVDLTFTRGGAGMFGSLGPVVQTFDGNVAKVIIGGRDAFTDEKLEWNSDRYGDVLRLSRDEEALINGEFNNYLVEKIQKHNLI